MAQSYKDLNLNDLEDKDEDEHEAYTVEDSGAGEIASLSVSQAMISTPNHEQNPKCAFSYSQHLRQIVSLTGPIIVSEIFQNTLPIVDIAFVGRLTTKEDLAAAALATVWFNLWNSTMLGFCTAVDTLLSQSYGAQEMEAFAMWTGNSLFIVSIVSFIVAGLIALCEPMMVLFGQDPTLASAAGQFSYRLLPGLLPYYIFKVLVKHLQTQNIVMPGALIGLFANGFNTFANWFFISYLDMGLTGAPIATTLTRYIELIVVVVYFYWKKHQKQRFEIDKNDENRNSYNQDQDKKHDTFLQTWPVLSLRNLNRDIIASFLKMATHSALSFTAEAWSFEITTILAGLLGTIALDAHIITLSISTFIYLSFPFAIGIATSIRVGQLIGEDKVLDAKRSSVVSFVLTFLVQGILIVILILPTVAEEVGSLFSNDDDVSDLAAALIPLSCIFMLGDAIQSNAGGVLRGLGRQKLLFILNVIGFWVLALPCGALLTFVILDIGVAGLWWGMTIGIYSSSLLGVLLLKFYVDWDHEAEKAQDRIVITHTNDKNIMNS